MSEPVKFVLRDAMYPHAFLFWFGDWDEKAIDAWCKRIGIVQRDDNSGYIDPTKTCKGVHVQLEFGSLIWMPEKPKQASHYSTLMHEVYHAVAYCGRRCGFINSQDSEEFYCFLFQWLSHNLFKRLWV